MEFVNFKSLLYLIFISSIYLFAKLNAIIEYIIIPKTPKNLNIDIMLKIIAFITTTIISFLVFFSLISTLLITYSIILFTPTNILTTIVCSFIKVNSPVLNINLV